ncbi:MAG: mechanosensitive ion channel domain-containing protein [Bryobacteraceae bacterium]
MVTLWNTWGAWLLPISVLAGSIVLALLVHYVVFAAGKRIAGRSGGVIYNSLVQHAEGPTRWIFPLIGIILALPLLPVRWELAQSLRELVGLGVIGAIAWAIILLTEVLSDAAYARYRVDISDNLSARRIRTQIAVLRRIFNIVVIVVSLGIMLMTFSSVRQLGTSVLASAGLAGLVVGMAMKPTLSNLLAGVQIALTEPIRIEDVVIVAGEYGWIEEIRTTYVVVRAWDLRRLVVPLSYFIENTFQNWTRQTADLLSYIYLYCDYTVPVEELRQEFRRVLESTPLWDKKVCVLQVSDSSPQSIQIRALASASDSGKSWDLQCYVRENLIRFLKDNYPESLPLRRVDYRGSLDSNQPSPGSMPPPGVMVHQHGPNGSASGQEV